MTKAIINFQARYNYTKSIQKIHSQLKKNKLEELKKLKALEKQRQKELEIYQGALLTSIITITYYTDQRSCDTKIIARTHNLCKMFNF